MVSDEQRVSENEGRRWFRRFLSRRKWILAGLAVFLAAYCGYRIVLWRQISSRRDHIRSSGHPVTLGDLNDYYPEPPEGARNAAELYMQAFSELSEHWEMRMHQQYDPYGSDFWDAMREGPPSPEAVDQLAAALDGKEATLELLWEAASLGHCRYPVQYSPGWYEDSLEGWHARDLQYIEYMERARILLRLEALMASWEDDPDRAFRCIYSKIGLAKSLEQEPQVQSQTTRAVYLMSASLWLEFFLSGVRFDDGQLAMLAEELRSADLPGVWERAAAGRRCEAHAFFHLLRKGGPAPDSIVRFSLESPGAEVSDLKLPPGYVSLGLWHLDYIYFLRFMDRSFRWYRTEVREALSGKGQPLPDRRAPQFDPPGIFRISQYCEDWGSGIRMDHGVVGEGFMVRLHWHVRAALIGVALERRRLETGAFPNELEELVPGYLDSVPLDPATNDPIGYERTPEGYMLFSARFDSWDWKVNLRE